MKHNSKQHHISFLSDFNFLIVDAKCDKGKKQRKPSKLENKSKNEESKKVEFQWKHDPCGFDYYMFENQSEKSLDVETLTLQHLELKDPPTHI